jgi:hypothetical protein
MKIVVVTVSGMTILRGECDKRAEITTSAAHYNFYYLGILNYAI